MVPSAEYTPLALAPLLPRPVSLPDCVDQTDEGRDN